MKVAIGKSLLSLLIVSGTAQLDCVAQDVFRAEKDADGRALRSGVGMNSCSFSSTSEAVSLRNAIDRALCTNPKSREAWVNIRIAADSVGINVASYLPSLSGMWQEVYEVTNSAVPGYPQYNSAFSVAAMNGNVNLNWTLFDFGGRKASVRNARFLLLAARASAAGVLQDVFSTTAAHYLAAQAALGKLSSASANVKVAEETLEITHARVDHGLAPISDLLQVQTAEIQSVIAKQEAEQAFASAIGLLDFDLGLRPTTAISIAAAEEDLPSSHDIEQSAEELLGETMLNQPSVKVARAQLEAAEEKVRQTRAAGLPMVSLLGKVSSSEQPASISLGEPPFLSTVHDSYIGVQISLPLFEGFSRAYQIRQAKDQVALQRESLHEAERQAELATWLALQDEVGSAKSALSIRSLTAVASRSYEVAKERYNLGVGGLLELLVSQKTLQAARDQSSDSLAKWHTSQFVLGSKIARLSLDRLKPNAPADF